MTHRTTFALDELTAKRLKRLSASWHVSQAEVVRRAVEMADSSRDQAIDPVQAMEALHQAGGGLLREHASEYLAEAHQVRKTWRDSE